MTRNSKIKDLVLEFLISDKRFSTRFYLKKQGPPPIFSVVLPVHNQENFILENLKSITNSMSLSYEIIVIEDNSHDKTRSILDEYFSTLVLEEIPLMRGIKYYSTDSSVFETRADNFGIVQAAGEYIIEIQADMKILEKAFDQKMMKILNSRSDLFALSARGVQEFEEISSIYIEKQAASKFALNKVVSQTIMHKKVKVRAYKRNPSKELDLSGKNNDFTSVFPSTIDFGKTKKAGWLGRNINLLSENPSDELKNALQSNNGKVWIGDTFMRGPLIFRRSDFLDIGGFDTRSFFLGDDDHSLCLLAKRAGKAVAFTPVYFTAPLHKGSERAHKTFRSLFWREIHRYARADNLRETELFKLLIKKR